MPYVVLDPRTVEDLRRCLFGPMPPRYVFDRVELALIDALADAVDEAQRRAGRPVPDRPAARRPDERWQA